MPEPLGIPYVVPISRDCSNSSSKMIWIAESGVGSESSTLISASGNTVSWSTNYNWANSPNNVKSCRSSHCVLARISNQTSPADPNVIHNTAKGVQVGSKLGRKDNAQVGP